MPAPLRGEDFEQHRVRHPPVEDDRGVHSGLDRGDAGLDLGDHAPEIVPSALQRGDPAGIEIGQQLACPCRARRRTSVSRKKRVAPQAPAIAPAIVSALIL